MNERMDRSKDSLEFKFFGLTRAMNRVLSTDFGYPYDCWKKPEEETVARIPFAACLLINVSINRATRYRGCNGPIIKRTWKTLTPQPESYPTNHTMINSTLSHRAAFAEKFTTSIYFNS